MKQFGEWGIELIKKLKSSLTAKIFLLTFVLLLMVCVLTYAFLVWLMPMTYTADRNQALMLRAQELVERLEQTTAEDCRELLDEFALENEAYVTITDNSGNQILESEHYQNREEKEYSITAASQTTEQFSFHTQQTALSQAIAFPFCFSDSRQEYQLMAVGNLQMVNQAVEALKGSWLYLLGAVLLISILAAAFYARGITKPIVKISRISEKISDFEFDRRCEEGRSDEIGVLAHNLNCLAQRLAFTMTELKQANQSLRQDIVREKQREQQQLEFFSAVSHELKTPITVLKGQLSGMLDNVGSYANREKYLARSLEVVCRMEGMVKELLTISRLEAHDVCLQFEKLDLSLIVTAALEQYQDVIEQREQSCLLDCKEAFVCGDRFLLTKAVCNLISNASFYSPQGAQIKIGIEKENGVRLVIENTGTQIPKESIGHLFEAFYRADVSRNRKSGGSGLGLYLVKMILEQHNADYRIKNTEQGVEVTLSFPELHRQGQNCSEF